MSTLKYRVSGVAPEADTFFTLIRLHIWWIKNVHLENSSNFDVGRFDIICNFLGFALRLGGITPISSDCFNVSEPLLAKH
jgi:hypothetical protein